MSTSHLRSPKRWFAIGGLCALIASLTYDLPIPGETEIGVDGTIGMVATFAILILLVRSAPVMDAEAAEVVNRHIIEGTMTGDMLFRELTARAERGGEKVTQLLKMLEAAPPGALAPAVDVLNSFEKLLEFLQRTLPTPPGGRRSNYVDAIKPDLWSYAPASCAQRLIDWARPFDKAHHGFLVRLAHSGPGRRSLSDAIKKANS